MFIKQSAPKLELPFGLADTTPTEGLMSARTATNNEQVLSFDY